MNNELHKRLEEAAIIYAKQIWPNPMCMQGRRECERDFLAGAEYGYKEAIALAKEWMKENIGEYTGYGDFDPRGLIMHFETDMNKLWEEQK